MLSVKREKVTDRLIKDTWALIYKKEGSVVFKDFFGGTNTMREISLIYTEIPLMVKANLADTVEIYVYTKEEEKEVLYATVTIS